MKSSLTLLFYIQRWDSQSPKRYDQRRLSIKHKEKEVSATYNSRRTRGASVTFFTLTMKLRAFWILHKKVFANIAQHCHSMDNAITTQPEVTSVMAHFQAAVAVVTENLAYLFTISSWSTIYSRSTR